MKKWDDKLSGSYYTPLRTVYFMREYLKKERKAYHRVLEPAAGDGRFIDLFATDESVHALTAVELMGEKVARLNAMQYPAKVKVLEDDFLSFAGHTDDRYHLIIGNPPYINLKNMDEVAVKRAKALCDQYGLSQSLMQNIWVAFVLASVSCLEKNGTIFFVLPMEFLQVQYAEKVRLFLEQKFDTIHILSFKERMFPEIEQEACLVYLTNAMKEQPYIYFKLYEKLDSAVPYYNSKIERNKPLQKWTNAVLSDEDIDLLKALDSRYPKVSEMCDASPGIVTGANNDFILDESQVERLSCADFILPTISKSAMLNGCFIVSQSTVQAMSNEGKKLYLLDLAHADEGRFSQSLRAYLEEIGDRENASGIKLKDRYKCRKRTPWYGVPIVRNGDLFFFKRYDRLPRICVNEANVYTTDIAYNMRLNKMYDKESMAFCFYNSLTLTQCEYYGRYYAGGVSELTPSEFKRLSIPYRMIEKDDIMRLSRMISSNEDIDKIVKFVNSKTLFDNISGEQIAYLDGMRKRLMKRRLPSI